MNSFDAIIERRGTNSYKWDVPEGELPMWVADMDFETAPAVKAELMRRVEHGVFGYATVPEEWYDAYIGWWKARHGFEMKREWMQFSTGVVAAISSAVKRLTNVGDNIVTLTPVYNIFFHSIENAGRHSLECKMTYDRGHGYALDYSDLERKLADPLTTLLIFCNPHNPTGRIWAKEEMAHIGELAKAHGVTVLSDEIHCDLTDPGSEYVPFASVNETCRDNSITCISASKAFNLAGLQTAAVVIPNEHLRNIVVRGLNSDEVAEPNCFACGAAVAALTRGGAWLDELRKYLYENKQYALSCIREIPKLHAVYGEATYLLWLDCGELTEDTDALCAYLREHAGLYLSEGSEFRGNGKQFLRLNLACPRSRLHEGLSRLALGIQTFLKG